MEWTRPCIPSLIKWQVLVFCMIFKKKCKNSVRINYHWVKYMQMADPFADISSDSEEDDDDGYVDQDDDDDDNLLI